MKTIKKVDVLSFALVIAFIEGILGFVVGFLSYILIAVTPNIPEIQSGVEMSKLGPIMIVIYPIMYYIVGFLTGLLGAYLYNIYASKWQGIKIELK